MPPLRFAAVIVFAAMMLASGVATGQAYPVKPIRMIAAEAGGANDVPARIVARELTNSLGQQVIVMNKAGGALAGELAASAAPDGYTLLFYGSSFWLLPFLQSNLSWDPIRDFSPITLATSTPNILVVNLSQPVKSVQELIALARAKPGQLNYGTASTGSGNHLAAELFKAMAGVNIIGVKYKGAAQALIDLMAGEVQLMFPAAGSVMPHIQAGKVRALAVTSAQPSAIAPGLPTIAAAGGLPGYESQQMHGVFAPIGTPPAVIARLNREIVRALSKPEVKEQLFKVGLETVGSSPEQFATTVKSDMAVLGKLIKDAGIRAAN